LFFLRKWTDKYGDLVRTYLETAADFEVISSLATISHLNSKLCYPTFSKDNTKIHATSLGHPLIETSERVYNNASFNNNIFIITGSNMSGKTTFLRTIGINLVLAYSGAEVCAEGFECGLLKIFTSMRISDDLSKGLSTFYVELTRIKTILDFLPKAEPMLFLIDEIFRGTNSNDRIIGAKTVLRNLNKPWCCGLISTHDFELCDLEDIDEGKIKNYHFREDYIDNKIHFDYKLRSGRSDTTNAKYLMKMIGIDI
jgi:DNA mismatch repair ATPase MutS